MKKIKKSTGLTLALLIYVSDTNAYLLHRKKKNNESMPTSKVLSNAVNTNNCFVVPKVVE